MRKREHDWQPDQCAQYEDDKKMMKAQRDFALDHQYANFRHVDKLRQ